LAPLEKINEVLYYNATTNKTEKPFRLFLKTKARCLKIFQNYKFREKTIIIFLTNLIFMVLVFITYTTDYLLGGAGGRVGVSDNETSPRSEHWGGARIAENKQCFMRRN
jgi:hypothetical protein